MTLPLPRLDKRDWSDLVDEGIARLPRRAPTWTDYNLHDPGITLLELLAYKVEQTLYQTNRVTERLLKNVHHLLNGADADADIPASIVCFPIVPISTKLEARSVFEMIRPLDGDGSFAASPCMRLMDEVHLHNLSLKSIDITGNGAARQQLYAGAGVQFAIAANSVLASLFRLTLSKALVARSRLSLFIEVDDGLRGVTREVDRLPDGGGPSPVIWRSGQDKDLGILKDETLGLSRSGIIELQMPDHEQTDQICCLWNSNLPWPTRRRITRVVINAARVEHVVSPSDNVYGPLIQSVHLEQTPLDSDINGFRKLDLGVGITRLRVTVSDQTGRVEWTRCQSLMGCDSTSSCFELDGRVLRFGNGRNGNGLPDSGVLLLEYDVLQPTAGVTKGTRWRAINRNGGVVTAETLYYSEPYDGQGTIRDEILKEVSKADASNCLSEMARQNGGTLDGLPLQQIVAVPSPTHAVSPSDYERLAFETPVVRILRVRAFPEIDVTHPGLPGDGTLSLVVLPDTAYQSVVEAKEQLAETLEARQTNLYQKTVATLDAVNSHLQQFRTIGTKLIVSPPKLSQLSVEIWLAEDLNQSGRTDSSGEVPETVQEKFKVCLQVYFDPILGGPDGRGCPMGEVFSQRDIFAICANAAAGYQIVKCSVLQIGHWSRWSLPVVLLKMRLAGDSYRSLR